MSFAESPKNQVKGTHVELHAITAKLLPVPDPAQLCQRHAAA